MDQKKAELEKWQSLVSRAYVPWQIRLYVREGTGFPACAAIVALSWAVANEHAEDPLRYSAAHCVPLFDTLGEAQREDYLRSLVQRFVSGVLKTEMRFDA